MRMAVSRSNSCALTLKKSRQTNVIWEPRGKQCNRAREYLLLWHIYNERDGASAPRRGVFVPELDWNRPEANECLSHSRSTHVHKPGAIGWSRNAHYTGVETNASSAHRLNRVTSRLARSASAEGAFWDTNDPRIVKRRRVRSGSIASF